jgi:hypothetical protein
MNADQLLRALSAIIDIPSIVIELPGEADYKFTNIQKVLTTQISRQKWKNFFRVLNGFNFMNFDVMEWIKGDTKGKFNLDEEPYERPRDSKISLEWFTLRTGRSSQVWINSIERVISKYDKEGKLQFEWLLVCKRMNEFPSYIRENCIAGAAEMFRKVQIIMDRGLELKHTRATRKYRLAQEVENYCFGDGAKIIQVLSPEEESKLGDNYKEHYI